VGQAPGQVIRFGCCGGAFGVLNGDDVTAGMATTTNLINGNTVNRNINARPSPLSPQFLVGTQGTSPGNVPGGNIYVPGTPDNGALHGDWTLTFSNGATTIQSVAAPGAQQAPFVNNVTVTGTGTNPTFTWTPPAGTQVNGYNVLIIDHTLLPNNGTIFAQPLAGTATSYTVPTQVQNVTNPTPFQLDPTHQYTIEIRLIQTKDGQDFINGQPPAKAGAESRIAAMSSMYADFKALPQNSPAVSLPVTLQNGSYQFNMTVEPGKTYYLDPTVATGYVYKTNPGDPNFASVTLPAIQSTPFHLSFMSDGKLISEFLMANLLFMFPNGGVDWFQVDGIDPALRLDPLNTLAFITGVTFVGAGSFTGTQTPITTEVLATPLPAALPLFASALGAMGFLGWRRKRKVAAPAAA
jgi:hypothetical protein